MISVATVPSKVLHLSGQARKKGSKAPIPTVLERRQMIPLKQATNNASVGAVASLPPQQPQVCAKSSACHCSQSCEVWREGHGGGREI